MFEIEVKRIQSADPEQVKKIAEALIDAGVEFSVKKTEEEKPQKNNTEKKPKAKTKKDIDMGKVHALLDGGWSMVKIADERE